MSYFIIGGTNVVVGQKSGGRNVGDRNVCGTYVCRQKSRHRFFPIFKKNLFLQPHINSEEHYLGGILNFVPKLKL